MEPVPGDPGHSGGQADQSLRPWQTAGGAVLLALLAVVVFSPAFSAGFLWDDLEGYAGNPLLRTLEGLRRIWLHPASLPLDGHYYPLVHTMFWVEHRLSGGGAALPHAVNIALHAVNAVLLWGILRRLRLPGAWLAAAVWAVHPLQVETVAWIFERKNTLSLLFWLLAVRAWLPLTEAWSWRRYAWVCVLFAGALLSKTSSVTLAPVLVVLHWWRVGVSDRRAAAGLGGLMAGAFAFGVFDMVLFAGRAPSSYGISAAGHAVLVGKTVWFYLGKLMWPTGLAPIYPKWDLEAGRLPNWLPLAALVPVAAAIAWRWRQGDRDTPAATLLFLAASWPFLGLIEYNFFGNSYAADHLMYHPSIPLVVLACAALARGAVQLRMPPAGGVVAGMLLVAVLGTASWRYCRKFHDVETLFTHALERNPGAFKAHLMLGGAAEERGEWEAAAERFRTAAEMEPRYAPNHSRLAVALVRLGRMEEALAASARALALDPEDGVSLANHANIVAEVHGPAEAVALYRRAHERRPGLPEVPLNLALALVETGAGDEALGLVEEHEALAGESARSRLVRGLALHEAGRTGEAQGLLAQVAAEDPSLAGLVLGGAKAHDARGRRAEALTGYRHVLLLEPDNATALNNAAWLLATSPEEGLRDGGEAVRLARRVEAMTGGRNPQVLDTLAAALAEAGESGEAAETARRAADLAARAGDAALAERIRSRVGAYEAGRPYRQTP